MIVIYILVSIVSLLILRLLFFIIRALIYRKYIFGWMFCPHCGKKINYKIKIGEKPIGQCKCGALWVL